MNEAQAPVDGGCTRPARRSIRAKSRAASSGCASYAVLGAARHLLRAAVDPLGRTPGRAVRPARAQVPHLRPDALAAGFLFPDLAADHRGAVAVLLHRARRPAVLRLRVPADGVDRDLPVDRALGRRQPHAADEAREGAVERARRSCARAPSSSSGSRSRCGRASRSSATSRRSASSPARSRASRPARGKRSGCCSTAAPPTSMPASCASRSASTCARTRASRARCSTRTR